MTLRDLATLDECKQVVALEKAVWGYTDAEDVVPVPILVVTVKRGGILIGAFDDADRMVGFVYSLPGIRRGRPAQWSHMLGVLPEYRASGLGRALKLAQRDRALGMGMDLVEWTYDPLQALNAHLNFARLGVIVEEYEENIYGDSSSPLHRGTPTDRFVAEWWIQSPRVQARIDGREDAAWIARTLDEAVDVNRTSPAGEWLECGDLDLARTDAPLAVHIPGRFGDMQLRAPALGREWRAATRTLFTTYLARGYRVTEFVLDRSGRGGRYLLSRTEQDAI